MDGLSRERKNATTMKKKLLTMLLVFAVVATYIPFDRAFAADENGKRQDKQVEKKVDKAAGKQEDKKSDASKAQPKKTPADKPESDAGGKDAGKDANKEGASTKSEKGFLPGKTNPGIDVDEPFSAGTLRRRIPYDDESCHLANFVYPSNPNKICFWSKHRNEQKTLTLSDASPHEKANFIDELYREIKHRIGRGGEYDIFISIDPTDNQLSISVPIKKGARIGTSILESIPEIRVMRGDTTYVATGWAESGSHDYTPPANRDVFADTPDKQKRLHLCHIG